MHITCHECDTIFNLDERLLKPSGSKVRCSQCGNIFLARPQKAEPPVEVEPIPVVAGVVDERAGSDGRAPEPDTAADKELEGIDLAELDAVLEKDTLPTPSDDDSQIDAGLTEETQADDFDLDLDFDMDLEPEKTAETAGTAAEAGGDLLDDLDLDMDFDLDDGEGIEKVSLSEDEQQPVEPDKDEFAFDMEETALESDVGTEMAGDKSVEDQDAQLSLDELDLDTIESEEPALATIDRDEETFDLADFDIDEPKDIMQDGIHSADKTIDTDQDLSLDDLDLEPVDAAEVDEASTVETVDSLDLEDLDLDTGDAPSDIEELASEDIESLELEDLEIEGLGDDEVEPEGVKADLKEDLDLSLDDLDFEEKTPKAAEPIVDIQVEEVAEEDMELSLDDGDMLDASVETAGPGGKAALAADEPDDVDLSDLGKILDQEEEQDVQMQDEGLDIELELAGDETESRKATSGDDMLEELEFELDAEFEDKPIAKVAEKSAKNREDEELDLSDIEQMLEGDTILDSVSGRGDASSSDTGAGRSEKWKADEDLTDAAGEIDLSEIEEALDSKGLDLSDRKDKSEDEDLDLDFSLEGHTAKAEAEAGLDDFDLDLDLEDEGRKAAAQAGPLDLDIELERGRTDDDQELKLELESNITSAPADEDEDEELDLSDLSNLVEDLEPVTKSETIDTGDIELEFEIEDRQQADHESLADRTFSKISQFPVDTTIPAEPVSEKTVPKRRMPKKKKGTSKMLVVVLVLLILGGGGYYGYDYVIKNDLQIPYLSDYINPKPKDPAGIANLSVLDINSQFMENEKAGRLFVISGKVRNGYPQMRGMIQIRGKLFSKGKVLVKTESAYAGLLIPDKELTSLAIEEIKKQINSVPDAKTVTAKVLSGQTLPFMVVFSDLPEDLDEFVIEKVGSQPAQ